MNPSSVLARTGDVQLSKKTFTLPVAALIPFEIVQSAAPMPMARSISALLSQPNLLRRRRQQGRLPERSFRLRWAARRRDVDQPRYKPACRWATTERECRQQNQ